MSQRERESVYRRTSADIKAHPKHGRKRGRKKHLDRFAFLDKFSDRIHPTGGGCSTCQSAHLSLSCSLAPPPEVDRLVADRQYG